MLCNCVAHQCEDEELFAKVLSILISTIPPLSDGSGQRLANVLLPQIIQAANLFMNVAPGKSD